MNTDPTLILLLQWQGVQFEAEELWEVLSLKDGEVRDYFQSKNRRLSKDWRDQAHRHLEQCQSQGLKLLPFWHPHYPPGLRQLKRPPWILCARGETKVLAEKGIAVVGSRKINMFSERWLEAELAVFLQNTGALVHSGGAYGVDQKAHRICVLHRVPTICWLPSGLLNIYPQRLRAMVPDILNSGGLLVSPFSPTAEMRKFHFAYRNQLIAACSQFTFVVQAKRRSGTMLTAKAAADMGSEVAALASAPTEEGLGGLDLICDGAHLIRDAADLKTVWEQSGGVYVN